jgi:segregation and condensation protein B
MQLSTTVEALVTASEDPLPAGRIVELLQARCDQLAELGKNASEEETAELDSLKGIDEEAVLAAITELNQHYLADGRAFQMLERAKGWKLFTRPNFAPIVGHLFPGRKTERLSGPALETLSIVAYRQPITKAAIEAVRGVNCDAMIQKLLDRELVRIGGRAELPGRPLLYETTDLFFEHFGIRAIDDLPNAQELRKARLPDPEAEDAANGQDAAEPEKQLVLSAVGKKNEEEKSESQEPQPAPGDASSGETETPPQSDAGSETSETPPAADEAPLADQPTPESQQA